MEQQELVSIAGGRNEIIHTPWKQFHVFFWSWMCVGLRKMSMPMPNTGMTVIAAALFAIPRNWKPFKCL